MSMFFLCSICFTFQKYSIAYSKMEHVEKIQAEDEQAKVFHAEKIRLEVQDFYEIGYKRLSENV